MNIIDPTLALLLFTWEAVKSALIPLFASLAGAYVGATTAFKFERKAKRDDEKIAHLNEIDFVIFQLTRNYNALVTFRSQFIEPYRHKAGRFVSIRPAIIAGNFDDKIDYRNIIFLYKSNDPEVLINLSNLNDRFSSVLKVVNHRNTLHYDKFQTVMEKKGLTLDNNIKINELVELLGERLSTELKTITDDLIEIVDDAINESINVKNSIRRAAIHHYEDAKLADFRSDDTTQNMTKSEN